LEVLILLGLLQAIPPVSIDMYLPSLPTLEVVFHATAASVQITMVTYLAGFALGQSLYGPITDRFGRKLPLYFGLALFVLSSIACALSPSIAVMSGFRLMQALGACAGSVVSRAMVRDIFPPLELRRVFSMLVLVLGVSPILAPLLGGYLLLWFGWRAAFLAQGTIGLICLIGIHFRLDESLAHELRRPLSLTAIRSGYARLFKDKAFLGASMVCGFSAGGIFAYITAAPFVFISLYKVPTEHFGWLFGSVAAGMVAASQVNGRMPHSIPLWKVLRVANIVQLFAATVLLASVLSGVGGLPLLYASIFVFVAAQGFVFPNGSAIAMQRHPEIAGTASAVLGTNQFLLPALAAGLLGVVDNPAVPMAAVVFGCALMAMIVNYTMLGARLEIEVAPTQHRAA
jgi:DHA1 family bicyclomycin/chloramphenicol resistance-like MFS transporter